MRKVDHNGKSVDAEVIDFEETKSPQWAVFRLADGTTMKVKFQVHEVMRVVGEFHPNGEPVYQMYGGATYTTQATELNMQFANVKKMN